MRVIKDASLSLYLTLDPHAHARTSPSGDGDAQPHRGLECAPFQPAVSTRPPVRRLPF